jgi:hypothetical protein
MLKASAVDVTKWYLYPGACQDRQNGLPGTLGTWAPKNDAQADSLDTYAANQIPASLGAYGRVDLSLKESLWKTPTFIAGQTPTIPLGTRTLWCGKFEPNFVVDVGYPNQTFQILYIDTGTHSANYNLTFLGNFSSEIDYDYVRLMGGGTGAMDPIGNSRAKLDELVSTGASGTSKMLITWTGSIQSGTPGATSINTVGAAPIKITGSGSAQPDLVPVTIAIEAQHRALYFLFTADCGYSSEDGLWPVGHGEIIDEVSVSDNFPRCAQHQPGHPRHVRHGRLHGRPRGARRRRSLADRHR